MSLQSEPEPKVCAWVCFFFVFYLRHRDAVGVKGVEDVIGKHQVNQRVLVHLEAEVLAVVPWKAHTWGERATQATLSPKVRKHSSGVAFGKLYFWAVHTRTVLFFIPHYFQASLYTRDYMSYTVRCHSCRCKVALRFNFTYYRLQHLSQRIMWIHSWASHIKFTCYFPFMSSAWVSGHNVFFSI